MFSSINFDDVFNVILRLLTVIFNTRDVMNPELLRFFKMSRKRLQEKSLTKLLEKYLTLGEGRLIIHHRGKYT